ncbi:hemin uptake protein HemP [Thalassoroseus pseudoceratinae]|uniref:hemin uptake protein HemP n=1 Tax=Thalassoroseus pseudoceratinae TaxID=2713176 RepID=UPI00141F2BF1|nr:hemin uptake protein HemP [Thalassoroseus pseudoceratinae]
MVESEQPDHSSEPGTPGSATPSVVRSEELLKGSQELRIVHEGETYRLRLTRNGKLILHK